jgi:hypothetical protein
VEGCDASSIVFIRSSNTVAVAPMDPLSFRLGALSPGKAEVTLWLFLSFMEYLLAVAMTHGSMSGSSSPGC